jgi:hypothetical protein
LAGISALCSELTIVRSMKQSLANLVRGLAVLLLFVPAPLAMVGVAPADAAPGVQVVAAEPAVEVPEPAEAEEEDPWTARFLAPAVVVIAVVAVGASLSYYVVRIRGRYRVV